MAVYISNCGGDESGGTSGGVAGDQTGGEWVVKAISGSWTYVLRHPDAETAKLVAQLATEAAENDKVGYDQSQRLTFWTQLSKSGYYPSKITTACEADCSSGVAAVVKAAGYLLGDSALKGLSASMYTGNEASCLTGVGFEKLSYTGTSTLHNGDVLRRSGHTATVVSGATEPTDSTSTATPTYVTGKTYEVVVNDLNVRKGAGTSYATTGSQLDAGDTVTVKASKVVGADVWVRFSGGWCAAYYGGSYYVSATAVSTAASAAPTYKVGTTYELLVDALNVRTGPGTSYAKKSKSQLTEDGQAHAYSTGALKKGTAVTCKSTSEDSSGNVWMQIPSGWVAAYYGGEKWVG